MAMFHHSEHSQARLRPTTGEQRLPVGQSMAVIAGLAILCWGVVVLFVVALWAVF